MCLQQEGLQPQLVSSVLSSCLNLPIRKMTSEDRFNVRNRFVQGVVAHACSSYTKGSRCWLLTEVLTRWFGMGL